MKQKYIWEGIIAIILIVGLIWFFTKDHQVTAPTYDNSQNSANTQTTLENPTNTTPATNQLTSNDTISVSTQPNNSKSVTIDNANLSKPGFIVIVIPGPSGKLNQVLGSSKLLTAGAKQDLEITIKDPLDSSIDYTALIYADDGDKKFNISKDTLVEGRNSSSTFIAK